MDARDAWQRAYHKECEQGVQLEKLARVGSFSTPADDYDCGSGAGSPARLADHGSQELCLKSATLTVDASAFRRHAKTGAGRSVAARGVTTTRCGLPPQAARGKGKMGVTFRTSASEGSVFIGKRTVKDGEACGIWDLSGKYRVVEGPKREWLCMSRVRFLDRHIADTHQYLVVCYRNGKKEHKRGPIALFEDPVKHSSITLLNAVTVDAFEVIIVYSEDEKGSVKRSVIHGPTVFVPDTSQWLHVFRWHGSVNGDQFSKVPGALVFTKLRTIADQFYYDANGVRTADDASIKVKVMVFFQMDNLELMLNSTHDPIGDFINGLLADLMNFGSRHTYEAFIQQAQQLSDLGTYKTLMQRAAAVGFKINKVVYRGYTASEALQSLCDKAIRTRTEMRLKQEEQEQAQRLRDMELKGNTSRGSQERDQQMAQQRHKLEMEAATHAEMLRREGAAHAEEMKRSDELHQARLRQQQDEQKVALAAKEAEEAVQLNYMKGLKDMGVDLTQYLVACAEKSPDKVLKIAMPNAGGHGINIHTRCD